MKIGSLYLLLLSSILCRLLFGTLLGSLLITCAAYFALPTAFHINPLGPTDLLLWFDELSEGSQALFASSAITVIGFLVAFQSATTNWKEEMQANLRLDTAREVHEIYGEATSAIASIEIYLRANLAFRKRILEECPHEEALGTMQYIQGTLGKFEDDRTKVYAAYSRACTILGRSAPVLFASGNTLEKIVQTNQAIASVVEKLGVYIPRIDLSRPDWKPIYLQFFQHEIALTLADECTTAHHLVSGNEGNITGVLTSNIVEVNFFFLCNFLRKGLHTLKIADAHEKMNYREAERAIFRFDSSCKRREKAEQKG